MLALVALLLAAPPPGDGLKLAVTDVAAGQLSLEKSAFFTETFAAHLARAGATVTTAKSIAAVLGLERQRQLLGCTADLACTVEIAAALGVDGVVLASVARVGSSLQLSAQVVAARSGVTVSSYTARVSDEEGVLEHLGTAARELVMEAARQLDKPLRPATAPGASVVGPWVLGGVAVVGAATGGVLFALAAERRAAIPTEPQDAPQPASLVAQWAREGQAYQTAGWVSVGVALAAAAGAVTWALAAKAGAPTVVVATGPGAAGLVVSGSF